MHMKKALRTQERLTFAQLAAITNANRNTLKVRLRELVSVGRVRQRGKSTRNLVFIVMIARPLPG